MAVFLFFFLCGSVFLVGGVMIYFTIRHHWFNRKNLPTPSASSEPLSKS